MRYLYFKISLLNNRIYRIIIYEYSILVRKFVTRTYELTNSIA